MIRRFNFESDIYETLSCVPMAVRRKLDRIGLKIGLDEWRMLDRGERLAICHVPVDSLEEREALTVFAREAVRRHCGIEPETLSTEQCAAAEPPSEPPARLIENARAHGVTLTLSQWKSLGEDERYALLKMGAGKSPSHNLGAALEELLGKTEHG